MVVSRLELFSIVDGRLTTSMNDVFRIINYLYSSDFTTIGFIDAYDHLKRNKPDWFIKEEEELKKLNISNNLSTEEIIKILEDNNIEIEITPIK